MLVRFMIAAVIAASLPSVAASQCRIAVPGTACVSVPQTSAPRPGPVTVGEVLERGEYSMLMNATYYGLPRVSDGWVYMQIETDIYRIDWRSHKVLERVTHLASRNWQTR